MPAMNTSNPTLDSAIILERPLPPRAVAQAPKLEAIWARNEQEVRDAQRLRYQVFADSCVERPGRD